MMNSSCDCNKSCCQPIAYICCGGSDKVAIVNLAEASHIGDIYCGENSDPYYIAISPQNKIAYVADYLNHMILKLDLKTNQMVSQTAVPGNPRALDVSPCGKFVYVVFDNQPIMLFLDSNLNNLGEIALPDTSSTVTVTNKGCRAYISQPNVNQTAVVNLHSRLLLKFLTTGINPGRMAYSPQRELLMVSGRTSHTLTPVNTCRMCRYPDIDVSGTTSGLAFASDNQHCLVAIPNESKLDVVNVNLGKVVKEIVVGEMPGGVAASKSSPFAVVGNQISDTINIINTKFFDITATLEVGNDPVGITVLG